MPINNKQIGHYPKSMPAHNPVTKIAEKRECYYFRDPCADVLGVHDRTNERKRNKKKKNKEQVDRDEHREEYNWFANKVEHGCPYVNRVGT